MNTEHLNKYTNEYSENGFFQKISRSLGTLAGSFLTKVLTLWYTLRDEDTPAWAKTVILGALGYFIVPVDAIPDILPMVGFSDDLTALVSASAVVWAHIKQEHRDAARNKLKSLFNI